MISILICSKYGDCFQKCVKSIVKSATSDDYEIIVKVDSLKDEQHRSSILEKLGAKFYILNNNTVGYENLHVMTNQIAAVAKGDLMWCVADDCYVIGDWYGAFQEIRELNPDNIFVINTRVGKNWAICPVVSRGWYETLGYVSACPANDFFLQLAGTAARRYLKIPDRFNLEIVHAQASAGIPKKIRKPAMKRAQRMSKYAARQIKAAVKSITLGDKI